MRSQRLIKTLALCALFSSPLAHAQPAGHMGRGMMEGAGPRMMWDMGETCPMGGSGPYMHGYPWRMNLNEEQRRRADEIFDKTRTRTRAHQEQMMTAQNRLRDALNKPKRDREEIMNAYRELEQLRMRNFETNLDAQFEFDQMLGK